MEVSGRKRLDGGAECLIKTGDGYYTAIVLQEGMIRFKKSAPTLSALKDIVQAKAEYIRLDIKSYALIDGGVKVVVSDKFISILEAIDGK